MIHYLRITLSLLSIGAILFIVYYVLTKLPGNNVLNKKNKRISFIEQMFLSPGVAVYIVKVDEQEFLVGVSNKAINVIQPLNGATTPTEPVDFAEVLKKKEALVTKSRVPKSKLVKKVE
ncbi:MAG: flagellar biosynthetic protein FliO [Candidatus Margulisbacteria bacterium]|nr:flagellar biosynthetic protein FliO [Candidatus Margulisiibacteriota bacterium]